MTDIVEDGTIIEKAIAGDTDAFGALYERYVRRIYNYIFYRTGNINDSEDLTARVFQRAFRHILNYDHRGVPFSAWLYRIAHNLVANWYRDRSRKKEVILDEYLASDFHHDYPERSLVQNQDTDKLMKAIRRLPPERQQLVILKFVEGMSNADIGVVMSRSEGAIKSLYHRTLESLRKEIEKIEDSNTKVKEDKRIK